MQALLLLFFSVLCIAVPAHAISMQHAAGPMVKCSTTPAARTDDSAYPGVAINKTNNLRRATGSGDVALGELVLVKGRVLDSKCLAVPGARVEIWHTDAEGKYKNKESTDINFVGSGAAETNNLGEFYFLTVLPGKVDTASAQFINFRVTKMNFPTLQTRMYFADVGNPEDDPVLSKIIQEQRPLLVAEPIHDEAETGRAYLFNVVLPGKVPYQRY